MNIVPLFGYIMLTCSYNVYPLTPHFYKVKFGFTGLNIIFPRLLLNIDCGNSLESHQRGGYNMYQRSMLLPL